MLNQKFGITIEKRSFKELGADAKQKIADSEAEAVSKAWQGRLNVSHIRAASAVQRAENVYRARTRT